MTIRDIAIAFGYEVDKASEKKASSFMKKIMRQRLRHVSRQTEALPMLIRIVR